MELAMQLAAAPLAEFVRGLCGVEIGAIHASIRLSALGFGNDQRKSAAGVGRPPAAERRRLRKIDRLSKAHPRAEPEDARAQDLERELCIGWRLHGDEPPGRTGRRQVEVTGFGETTFTSPLSSLTSMRIDHLLDFR
jgi:hypothetical protein